MSKKKIIIIILVILILISIYMLYNTFAINAIVSNDNDIYTITLTEDNNTITVPAGSSKTIYYHIKNTNKGKVKYAVGYNSTASIEVKVYNDSIDKETDLIDYGGNKFIKLYLNNTSSTDSTVTLSTILGYEHGGNLIVPNNITPITEEYTPPPKTTPIAEYITNLYTEASKSTVTNNSITYNTAPSVFLMNDRLGGTTTSLDGGNIRYYGASPNNYIYFNCSDYSNQSSSTCELWRIIGVFDGKLKIMRNESIGSYSWDTSASTINYGSGVNEWSQADLMKLLNPGYTSETVGGSLYYNSSSGTCYNGSDNSTTSCNFTTTGIKNDVTRNKIATVMWNTGAFYDSSYPDGIYQEERGTAVPPSPFDEVTRTTSWTGKIALPYPSDYGYAANFSLCNAKPTNYSNCSNVNWIKNIVSTSNNSIGLLLLTPSLISTGAGGNVWYINVEGNLNYVTDEFDHTIMFNAVGVSPALFLNAEETIVNGTTGTSTNPYKLNP